MNTSYRGEIKLNKRVNCHFRLRGLSSLDPISKFVPFSSVTFLQHVNSGQKLRLNRIIEKTIGTKMTVNSCFFGRNYNVLRMSGT
ncbi:hypothetical protein Hanom_Chr01g00063591 [Helianthus anomalus]